MDIQKLAVFACVAEFGSLSRASIALGAGASLISRQIAALERECGGPLFHRTGRGVVLTALGARILPRVKVLLDDAKQLEQDIHSTEGALAGEVRIGLVPSLTSVLIAPLVRTLQERHPCIRLHVLEGSSGQLDAWRASGLVDITVLFRHALNEIHDEQPLGAVDNYLMGVAGDPVTRASTVSFERLSGLPLILPGIPNGFRIALDQVAKKRGATLKVMLETNSLNVQAELVRSGCGYSIMAAHAAAVLVRTGGLQASRIVNPALTRTITLGITSARPNSAATRETARLWRLTAQDAFTTLLQPR